MQNKKINIDAVILLSVLIYFLQSFEGLPGLAFTFFLKNLGWSPSKMMIVGSLIGLAWLVKPLIGIIIDKYLTKKAWILISITGSIIMATTIGLFTLPIGLVCVLMAIASTNTAIRDISVDGLSVIKGTETNNNSNFQSSQWISITVASCIVGVCGGYIADHFSYKIAFLCLIPVYLGLIYFVSKSNIKEEKVSNVYNWKELLKHKEFWLVCLFLFLFKFSPSTGTPLYFIEVDKFKWSQTFIGTLGTVSAIVSILGACLYRWYIKNHTIDKKKLIIVSVFLSATCSLCYLYFTPVSDIIYTIVFSFISMIIFLMIMTFMADNCIKGMESTSFAILCSISNLAGTASGLSGGFLYPIIGLQWLIVLSSVTSFLCLPFVGKIFSKKLDTLPINKV